MPSINDIRIVMAEVPHKLDGAMVFDLSLNVELNRAYVYAENGMGKTSSIIQPYMWMFDRGKVISGRTFRDLVSLPSGRNPRVPYVYYIDWRLDSPDGAPLDRDSEMLVTGFVVSNAMEQGERVDGFYFLFPHSEEEYRMDREGLLRRYGLDVYSRKGNSISHRDYAAIKADVRAKGASVFSFKDSGSKKAFTDALERDWNFFDIGSYLTIQEFVVEEEDAIGKLRERFRGNESGLLKRLVLPVMSSTAYPGDDKKEVDRSFLAFVKSLAENRALIAEERKVDAAVMAAKAALEPVSAREKAAEEVLEAAAQACLVGKGIEEARNDAVRRLAEFDAAIEGVEERKKDILLRKLSHEIWVRKRRLAEAEAEKETGDIAMKEAADRFAECEELVKRAALIEAADACESAEAFYRVLEEKREGMDESELARALEAASASIWKKCMEAAVEEEGRRTAALEAAERLRAEAAEAGEAETVSARDAVEASAEMGRLKAMGDGERRAAAAALGVAGCRSLFKDGQSPDIAGIEAKKAEAVRAARAAEEKRFAQAAALEGLRPELLAAAEEAEEAREAVGEARVVLAKREQDARLLEDALLAVDACGISRPRRSSEIDASIDASEKERLEAAAKKAVVENELRDLRSEETSLKEGVGLLPEALASWIEERGFVYQTGQDRLRAMADAGEDVAEILEKFPHLPFSVIVSSDSVEQVAEAAQAADGKEWSRGLALLLTEEEAVDFDRVGFVDSGRIIGLSNKNYLIDPVGYLEALSERGLALEEDSADLDRRISSLAEREEILRSLANAARSTGVPLEDFEAVLNAARSDFESTAARAESAKAVVDGKKGEIAAAEGEVAALSEEAAKAVAAVEALVRACESAERFERIAGLLAKEEGRKDEAEKERIRAAAKKTSALEAAARAESEAVAYERKSGDWKERAAGHVAFDADRHDAVDMELSGLEKRYKTLFSKVGEDRSRLEDEIAAAGRNFEEKRALLGLEDERYSSCGFGGIEEARRRGAVHSVDRNKAVVESERLRNEKAFAAAAAEAAAAKCRERIDELSRAWEDFDGSFPERGGCAVAEEEIGGTDFAAQERRADDLIGDLKREKNSTREEKGGLERGMADLGAALAGAEKKAGGGLREKAEQKAARMVGVCEGAEFEAETKEAISRLSGACAAFSDTGTHKAFRSVRMVVDACRPEDEAFSMAERFETAVGCVGLGDVLGTTLKSWEFEKAAIREKLETRDTKRRVTVEFLLDSVNSLVLAARHLEKASGRMMRLKNVSKGGEPYKDESFAKTVEAWVDKQAGYLAEEAAKGLSDGDLSERIRSLTGAYSLLGLWAEHNGSDGIGFQMRVMSGDKTGKWETWKEFCKHSGGEVATSSYKLFLSFLSLSKAKGTLSLARRKTAIPLLVDAPFQSVSNDSLISGVFDVADTEGVQMICVSDRKMEARKFFPKRYDLFVAKKAGGFSLSSRLRAEDAELVNAAWEESGIEFAQRKLALFG